MLPCKDGAGIDCNPVKGGVCIDCNPVHKASLFSSILFASPARVPFGSSNVLFDLGPCACHDPLMIFVPVLQQWARMHQVGFKLSVAPHGRQVVPVR